MEPAPVRPSIALVLLAVCAGLLALGYFLLRAPDAGSVSFEPAPEEARPRARAADLEQAEVEQVGESRRAEPEPEPVAFRSSRTSGGLGTLRICAVDAQSGAELDRIRVRVASVARIADRQSAPGSAELALTLTPGSYWLVALSRGYEPLELPAFDVVAGEVLALEPLRLRRGSARVLGFASGDVRPERQLRAELLGAESSATIELGPDGRFGFEELVSGKYALRLIDPNGQPLGLGQSFELLEGQTLRLEPEAHAARKVEVELLDTDGTSLATEWSARVRAAAAKGIEFDDVVVYVETAAESAGFTCTFRADERYLGQAFFAAPEPPDAPTRGGTVIASGRAGRRVGPRPLPLPDDRPRARNEALLPDAPAPVLHPASVEAGVGEDGLAHFEPLPAIALRLELSCGPFRASVAIPAGSGTARVQARLERTGPGSSYREWTP